MVRLLEYPSWLNAACWSVLVVNGAGAVRLRSFFAISDTVYAAPSRSFRIFSAASLFSMPSFVIGLPPRAFSDAGNCSLSCLPVVALAESGRRSVHNPSLPSPIGGGYYWGINILI